MQITIRTLTGANKTLQVEQTDTVQSVKDRIHASLDFSVADRTLRLVLNGHDLSDEPTLAACGVEEGTVIHLAFPRSSRG